MHSFQVYVNFCPKLYVTTWIYIPFNSMPSLPSLPSYHLLIGLVSITVLLSSTMCGNRALDTPIMSSKTPRDHAPWFWSVIGQLENALTGPRVHVLVSPSHVGDGLNLCVALFIVTQLYFSEWRMTQQFNQFQFILPALTLGRFSVEKLYSFSPVSLSPYEGMEIVNTEKVKTIDGSDRSAKNFYFRFNAIDVIIYKSHFISNPQLSFRFSICWSLTTIYRPFHSHRPAIWSYMVYCSQLVLILTDGKLKIYKVPSISVREKLTQFKNWMEGKISPIQKLHWATLFSYIVVVFSQSL